MQAAGRRDQQRVAPGREPVDHHHPFLGPADVRRPLARAKQPTVDVADCGNTDDPSRRHRGHRLVDQRHAFADPARLHVGVAQQGHGVKLEVSVAEAPGNRQCGLGEPLSLGRVIAERRAVEREPPMLNALVQRIQRAIGLREPAVRRSQIPMDATVQKGEAPSHLGRSLAIAGTPVEVEGFGLQLDRAIVLAQPLKGFGETGQRLRAAAHVQTALELHPGNHPVGGCQRLAPLPERVVGDLAHRPMIPDRRRCRHRSRSGGLSRGPARPRPAAPPAGSCPRAPRAPACRSRRSPWPARRRAWSAHRRRRR